MLAFTISYHWIFIIPIYFQSLLWPVYVFLASMPWWCCDCQLKLQAAWKDMFFMQFWICHYLVSLDVSLI